MIIRNKWHLYPFLQKKQLKYLALIMLFLNSTFVFSQITFLKSQEDIDAFDTSINNVEGSIIIESIDGDIFNLHGLSNVVSLSGSLLIHNNSQLASLEGLNGIDSIGLSLEIINNDSLVDLNDLTELKYIGNDIKINGNSNLLSITGLNKIKKVCADFDITNNEDLTSLNGLDSIDVIHGYLRVFGNSLIENLEGLGALVEIGDYFRVADNTNLLNLKGTSRLNKIGSFLSIRDNENILEIDDLSNLTRVGGYLTIRNNVNLESINGLRSVILIEGPLQVQFNDKLRYCCGVKRFITSTSLVLGNIDVSLNSTAPGCRSIFDILAADCGLEAALTIMSSCENSSNGSISVFTVGEDSFPIYYEWTKEEDGTFGMGSSNQSNFMIENLSEGTYDLVIYTDTQEGYRRNNIIIETEEGSVFEISEISTSNSSNNLPNGSITINYNGGQKPFSVAWTGTNSGGEIGIENQFVTIPNLNTGTYSITLVDNNGLRRELSVAILDDTVPVFECNKPFDIVILNDVSGSVDAIEYKQSQEFFIEMINVLNVGMDDLNSNVAIAEWSSIEFQEIKIELTGDTLMLQNYSNLNRSFYGNTSPNEALAFGKKYLEENSRPNVPKVIILSTDAKGGQVSQSLIEQANQYKSEGYIIITIAFDDAYNIAAIRQILSQVASINNLAPGAPSYDALDQEVAESIVNIYICPVDPGSSSSVYFHRDGIIEVKEIKALGNCPNPVFADITFEIFASEELSIPANTPVSFYLNDPQLTSATHISTFNIPCSIPAGDSELYEITLPVAGPSLIHAVLNDDNSQGLPVEFPITDISELYYSNNIDFERVCVNESATIQATKYTTSPIPVCDSIVNMTTNVCNIGDANGLDISIEEEVPEGFELINSTINLNNCASSDSSLYDIPIACCVTINYSYDVSQAIYGEYNDHDVVLDGPNNQTYLSFDGAMSSDDDISWTGPINCPSTIVEISKEVSKVISCDDNILTYTFSINNEMNIPLQGLTFRDELPFPCEWLFQPYNKSALSIDQFNLSGQIAEFTIAEVLADTVASFSIDIALNTWNSNSTLENQFSLGGIAGVLADSSILFSNIVSTEIIASPIIETLDTIIVGVNSDSLLLTASTNTTYDLNWSTSGEGELLDSVGNEVVYLISENDKEEILFFVSITTDCHQSGEPIVVVIDECTIEVEDLEVTECYNNDTPLDGLDDFYEVSFNTSIIDGDTSDLYYLFVNEDTLGLFEFGEFVEFTLVADGEPNSIVLQNSVVNYCSTKFIVSKESCSTNCDLTINSFELLECQYDNSALENYVFEINVSRSNIFDNHSYYLLFENDTVGVFSYDTLYVVEIENLGLPILNLSVMDSNGCTEPINLTLNVFDYVAEVNLPDFLCAGDESTLELSISENENLSYQWYPTSCILSGENSTSPTIVADNENKLISLIISNDSTGCFNEYLFDIPVYSLDIEIQAYPDSIINLGDSVVLELVEVVIGDTYEWSNGVTTSNQTVIPETSTTYQITVTDDNGCTDTDDIIISVLPVDCSVFIPKAFSPNNDGVNDVFFVRSKTLNSMELIIYNRLGEEVFYSNDQNIPWDGTWSGEELATDAFAFYFKGICLDGNEIIRKGNISILR